MATLSELTRFREDLQKAVYSGVRRLRDQNGEEIEYRSQRELKMAMAALDTEIAAATAKPPKITYLQTSKGV